MLRNWNNLPKYMRNKAVLPYYNYLKKKQFNLYCKRGFDFVLSFIMLLIFFPVFLVISLLIVIDSKGNIFFCQERITQYGRKFKIIKFRTMVANAENKGSLVTTKNDMRITRVGKILRKYRLDELPQLINIFFGDMSFVGTRPEVTKYVKHYTPEMMATLLLPAGVTSECSIHYRNEEKLLESADNIDEIYLKEILPEKMKYNLASIMSFSCINELATMIKTIVAVLR